MQLFLREWMFLEDVVRSESFFERLPYLIYSPSLDIYSQICQGAKLNHAILQGRTRTASEARFGNAGRVRLLLWFVPRS